jgi:hypothetical protein
VLQSKGHNAGTIACASVNIRSMGEQEIRSSAISQPDSNMQRCFAMSITPIDISSRIEKSLKIFGGQIIILALTAVHDERHKGCYALLVIALSNRKVSSRAIKK